MQPLASLKVHLIVETVTCRCWPVYPDATVASVSRHADGLNGDATVNLTLTLTELVNLLRDTQRQNVELAAMLAAATAPCLRRGPLR